MSESATVHPVPAAEPASPTDWTGGLRGSRGKLFWSLCALLTILFLVLGFHRMGSQEPIPDEILTSGSLRRTTLKLITNRFKNGHPPVYFLMLQGLVKGLNVIPHRYPDLAKPSVFLGALCVPAVAAIGLRLGLGFWALLAAGLCAVHPSMLFYARVARPYSGACLILLIQLYAWIGLGQAAPERKKAWVWFLLAAGALGVAWNHMLALFWGVLLLAWALFPVRALYPRATLYVLIASFLGHASLWVLTMVQPYDPIAWVKDKGRANAFNELAGYFVGEWETGTRSFPPMVLGVLLFAVFLGTLFWLLRQLGRRHISCNNATSCSLLVLGFLAVLPCLGVTLTHFLIKPVLQVRYILMFLPPLFLVFAVYLNGVRWGKFAAGFICLVAVCCGFADLRETERHQYGTRRSVERIKELYEADSDALLVSNHMVAETARLFKVKKIELILPASDRYDPAVQVSDVPTAFNRIKRLWIIQVKDLPPMPPRSEIPSALGAVLVEEQIGLCKISCREVIPPPEPK